MKKKTEVETKKTSWHGRAYNSSAITTSPHGKVCGRSDCGRDGGGADWQSARGMLPNAAVCSAAAAPACSLHRLRAGRIVACLFLCQARLGFPRHERASDGAREVRPTC